MGARANTRAWLRSMGRVASPDPRPCPGGGGGGGGRPSEGTGAEAGGYAAPVSVAFSGRTFADSFRISCARPRRCQIYHCGHHCRDQLDLAPRHRPALPGVVRCDVAAGAGMCAPSVLSGAAPPPHRRHTTVTSPTHASATHARPAVP